MSLYPLAPGNKWTYRAKDGALWSNEVTASNGSDSYTMINSVLNKPITLRREGNDYITDAYEPGTWNVSLRENLKTGDTWEIHFTANGIQSILVMTVKGTGLSQEVEGKTYTDVTFVESESKMSMNGTVMSLNFLSQYYYAPGTGLILTTSSYGDYHGLVKAELN